MLETALHQLRDNARATLHNLETDSLSDKIFMESKAVLTFYLGTDLSWDADAQKGCQVSDAILGTISTAIEAFTSNFSILDLCKSIISIRLDKNRIPESQLLSNSPTTAEIQPSFRNVDLGEVNRPDCI